MMKVFELAKDLDMGAIELVEKLKAEGMNVRNHMVALSPDEVDQAKALFKPTPKEAKATKKVVKKKTTRKKVVRKAATKAKEATDEEKDKPKKKKKVVTVKRRSKQSTEETVPKKTEDTAIKVETSPVVSDEPVKSNTVEASEVKETESSSKVKGLNVVYDPSADKKEEVKKEEVIESKEEASKPEEVKVYKEKMHSFTPVYVPEDKPENKEGEKTSGDQAFSREKKDDEASHTAKKRMGNLASLVSKKGSGSNRSQDLTLLRANEDLKMASTLTGQAVYIPARRKKVYTGETKSTEITEVKEEKRVIQLHGGATASDIAGKLSVKFSDLADKALEINLLINEEDYIGIHLASEIAHLYNYRVEDKAFNEKEVLGKKEKEDKSHLPLRDPIITVMGHVDHGKTTLLDHIRKAKIASGEAGGITQHIGAYSVPVADGKLTFLDTPGHAAFGAMRQRGADLTDIVILVVAADDGVMPQTVESIKYIKNSNVPVIVAVNKMDKEGANPDRIKQKLVEYEITPEEWGGDTPFIEISALKGNGIDDLLEAVHLQAEIMELRESDKGKAEGVVIEAKVESGRGSVATILVQKGTLKKGDSIVVGENYGRARSLIDFSGKDVKSAGPSIPVQVLGLNGTASPGDTLDVVKNEREAKKIVANRIQERKDLEAAGTKKMSLEDFFADAGDSNAKVLNLIIRSDVQGSYEAIKTALETLGNNEVKVKILGGGVGAITDNDVMLAASAEGYILGFNMRPMTSARKLAEQKGVDIKNYSIIYELINDVKLALEGLLDPERIEKFIGRAEVRETFVIPKVGVIAGSFVIDGKIIRGCNIRLLRNERIVFDGKMSSLKRFKDDAKEVTNGYECGVSLEGFNDIQKGDLFEAYTFEEKKRTLESSSEVIL